MFKRIHEGFFLKVHIMKKFRAFILAEQLLTIMLQAGFILVLCGTFYLLTSFYANMNQALTARNHAERVISFLDSKIRQAGLGLWRCDDAADIRNRLAIIPMLSESGQYAYNLPISVTDNDGNMNEDFKPKKNSNKTEGDVLTLLYAQSELSSGDDYEIITLAKKPASFSEGETIIELADNSNENLEHLKEKSVFSFSESKADIRNYAVSASFGFPIYLHKLLNHELTVGLFGSISETVTIPAASELLALKCMQMFVRTDGDERQFVYRELTEDGAKWKNATIQEDNILDIYMKLESNVLTLCVLASGGKNTGANTPRPETWPKEANPKANTDEAAKAAWLASDYCNHIVYVSRQSWRLHNVMN